jgi:hypothetical protein
MSWIVKAILNDRDLHDDGAQRLSEERGRILDEKNVSRGSIVIVTLPNGLKLYGDAENVSMERGTLDVWTVPNVIRDVPLANVERVNSRAAYESTDWNATQ